MSGHHWWADRPRLNPHQKYKRHRTRLWLEDPHCWRCGVATVLICMIRGRPPDNMATLDHRLGREEHGDDSLPRKTNRLSPKGTVIACYHCNCERAIEQMPSFHSWPENSSGRPELSVEAVNLLNLLWWAYREVHLDAKNFGKQELRRLGFHVQGDGSGGFVYAILKQARRVVAEPDEEGGVRYRAR